jgi:hypothetical protein
MIISDKQQEANRRNAQHSTGPKTPDGKAAMRLNALKYGLRARDIIIFNEDPEEYQRLWASLETEWQPQTCTERLYLEQMCTSQWLLARITGSELNVYYANIPAENKFALLGEVGRQRTRLERSFTSALHELKQLQKERRPQPAQPPQHVPTKPAAQSKQPPAPPPDYVMSEGAENQPVSRAPASPDTR